jgi:hypothetical protein
MRVATAVCLPAVVAGSLLLLDLVRPGMGIALLVLAVALFAAGGVNERYRSLWIPFAIIGGFLAALNFTPLDVPTETTGIALCAVAVLALVLGAGRERLGSTVRTNRP